MSTVSLVNETQFHVVAVGPVQMASGGGSSGELFILDVTPTSTGLVGEKTYIGSIAHELPVGDTVAGVPGSSAWKEPVSVWNNGSPEYVFDGTGEVVMSDAS